MINRKKIFFLLGAIFILCIGFVLGMEYKAYQVRSAISEAFSETETEDLSTSEPVVEEAKKDATIIVEKAIGDEIILATGNITVNSSEEMNTLSSTYGSPKVAKEGTKFVVINMDVVNTTKSEFSFSPDNVFLLQDNQEREFRTYDDSIGSIGDYLNYRDLSPSVKENGSLVYEVPVDAASYQLVTSKAGTNELYIIKLK